MFIEGSCSPFPEQHRVLVLFFSRRDTACILILEEGSRGEGKVEMNQGSPVASRVRTPLSPFCKFPGYRPGPTSLNGGQLSSGLPGVCFSNSLVSVSTPFPSGTELAILHDLGRSLVNLLFQVCGNNASGVPPQHIEHKRPKRRSGTLHRRPLTIGILFQCIPLWRWETRKEVDRSRWRPTHRLP